MFICQGKRDQRESEVEVTVESRHDGWRKVPEAAETVE